MKVQSFLLNTAVCALAGGSILAGGIPPSRIGVYDSREVAYAHFLSTSEQAKLLGMTAATRIAQDQGNRKQAKALGKALKERQERIHMQVFSTVPADEAMAELKARRPALLEELAVSGLVSKWDAKALRASHQAEKVDVTECLVKALNPVLTDKQKQTLAEIQRTSPIAPWRARLMSCFGGM